MLGEEPAEVFFVCAQNLLAETIGIAAAIERPGEDDFSRSGSVRSSGRPRSPMSRHMPRHGVLGGKIGEWDVALRGLRDFAHFNQIGSESHGHCLGGKIRELREKKGL